MHPKSFVSNFWGAVHCQRLFQFLMYMMTDKIIVSEKIYHICQHCRNHQIMSTIKAGR